jgi:hypothetical protein
MNIFVGNVIAITQQALWGERRPRALPLDGGAAPQRYPPPRNEGCSAGASGGLMTHGSPLAAGQSLDYAAVDGGRPINYAAVVRGGLQRDGVAAFFTPAKWFSRVLMNAPAQGILPVSPVPSEPTRRAL